MEKVTLPNSQASYQLRAIIYSEKIACRAFCRRKIPSYQSNSTPTAKGQAMLRGEMCKIGRIVFWHNLLGPSVQFGSVLG